MTRKDHDGSSLRLNVRFDIFMKENFFLGELFNVEKKKCTYSII